MHINRGINLAKKFYPLIFIPIILDIFQLGDILRRVKDFNIRFTLPAAIPSLTQILSDVSNGTSSGFTVNTPFSSGGIFIIFLILSIVLGAYLKGGFLGCVLAGVKGEEVSIKEFWGYSRYYFSRFLFQLILTFLVALLFLPIAFIFGPLAFLPLVGALILIFFLIFWDYIIVTDDTSVIDGAKESINLIKVNIGRVLSFVFPIVLFTAFFSVIANYFVSASTILAVVAIILYSYYATVVVFAVMSFYMEISDQELPI